MERPPAGPTRLPPATAVLLALAVAWAAFAAWAETSRGFSTLAARQSGLPGVMGWREGMFQVERFRRFADSARPHLPAGSKVVFFSPENAPGQNFFRSRWAAYMLPEVDIIAWPDPAAAEAGEYVLGYRQPIAHPRVELLQRLPDGWLYRVRPPAP